MILCVSSRFCQNHIKFFLIAINVLVLSVLKTTEAVAKGPKETGLSQTRTAILASFTADYFSKTSIVSRNKLFTVRSGSDCRCLAV